MSSTDQQRAKRPRTILAGPYGHPVHPVLVTIPIGAWVSTLVFDIASRVSDDGEAFVQGAQWLVGIGIVGALLAAVFGLLDLTVVPRGTKAFTVGLAHMTINLVVVALFVVNFFLRNGQDSATVEALPLTLTVVGLLLLAVSGTLGGMLAYHYGVRVADEATQQEGFR